MQKKKNTNFIKGFSYAWQGIIWNLINERNMRFHLGATIIVVAAGLYFQLWPTEWVAIILCCTLVPALELVNSAVESSCDVLRDRLHLGYRETKLPRDLAAGAVLWAALGSVVVGLVIFLPKVLALL